MAKVYTLHWEDREDQMPVVGIFSTRAKAEERKAEIEAQEKEKHESFRYHSPYKSYWWIETYSLDKVQE